MISILKIQVCIVSLAIVSLRCSSPTKTKVENLLPIKDTVAPVLFLAGPEIDTVYVTNYVTTTINKGDSVYTWDPGNVFVGYEDRGAEVMDEVRGERMCSDLRVNVEGAVNTRVLGTYYLHYSATDAAGNKSSVLTRTVHVLENAVAFLGGQYTAVCSYTALPAGSLNPWVSSETYTAVIYPKSCKNRFELVNLKIGAEKVVTDGALVGNSMELGFFSPDYANGTCTGTLSPTKESFTIESTFYAYSQAKRYQCKNVFTKSPDLLLGLTK